MSNLTKTQQLRKKYLNSINQDLFSNYNKCISIQDIDGMLERATTRRPITFVHIECHKQVKKFLDSDKKVDKFISNALEIPDIYFESDIRHNTLTRLLCELGYDFSLKLFKKLKDKNFSGHDFFNNFPVDREIKHPELAKKFILKILDYSFDNINELWQILGYINYKKVLEASNKLDILNNVNVIAAKKALADNGDTLADPLMLINNMYGNNFVKYSKNALDITGVGQKTMCCFKKGGVGEPLMLIALKSPISAIIHGNKDNKTWFSFVWELVEYNNDTKSYDIHLILDNIEANNYLNSDDYNEIMNEIKDTGYYKNIHLGYMRNDIEVPIEVKNTEHTKSRQLIHYQKEFNKYGSYDDSKRIYNCFINDTDEDYEIKKIDSGEFARICYIIEDVINSDRIRDYIFVEGFKKLFKSINKRNTIISEDLDIEKSFIKRSKNTIVDFELYDNDGTFIFGLEKSKKSVEEKINELSDIEYEYDPS